MQPDLPPHAVTEHDAARPVRRNRDRAERRAGADQERAGPQQEAGRSAAVSPALQEVLDRGHLWLRFPQPWEGRFQEDCAPARRKLLAWCAVIGIIAYWLVAANDVHAVPDMAHELTHVRTALTSLMVSSLIFVLAVPTKHKRNWHFELATCFNTLILGCAIVWIAMTSRHLTATAHTAAITTVVMYTAIAARQRFWWTLGTAIFMVGSYMILARGFTPMQALMVDSNVNLVLLATLCTLGANYALEYLERRLWVLHRLSDAHRQSLSITRQTLDELAKRDALTGLYNRRQFDAELLRAWQLPGAQPVSLVLLDVDHFKPYNDTYGHLAGDACLQDVAKVLSSVARNAGGVAARIGGEEFALLLAGQPLNAARQVAELVCSEVRKAAIEHRSSTTAPHVTVSAGVASTVPGHGTTADALFNGADQGLYQAKGDGRDRVGTHIDEQGLPQPPTQHQAPPASTPPQAMPKDEAQALADMEQDMLREVLAKPRLKFPPIIEARYQSARERHRKWILLISCAAGLSVLNGYLHVSRPMFSDAWEAMAQVQALLSPAIVLIMAMACFLRIRPWVRDLLYAVSAAAVAFATALALSHSSELTALAQAKCLVLIPLFACVAGRLPLGLACIPALVTIASLGLFSNAFGPEGELILQLSAAQVIGGTVYSLIAAYTLERDARRAWLTNRLGRLQSKELEEAAQRLRSLSTLDPLTGISNRRHFEQRFDQMWEKAKANKQAMSMLILDVDHFKLYNDGYGHAAGDLCLKQFALILQREAAREDVMVARLGGEEFAILLAGKPLSEAIRVGEAVCAAVRDARMEHRFSRVARHVTVSVGASCLEPWNESEPRALIRCADDALYQAKTLGRDRVCSV